MQCVQALIDKFASDNLNNNIELDKNPLGALAQTKLGNELVELLSLRNGFFAFESSLHIFPVGCGDAMSLMDWNELDLWKNEYNIDLSDVFCFGENIFGEQFCLYNNSVCRFDPETGNLEVIADSIDLWARMVIEDYNFHTGYSLAHEWQKRNGPLDVGYRLVPRLPFVCGGEFSADNLALMGAVESMKSRANLSNQIAKLPDGAQIEFKPFQNCSVD